MTTKKPIETKVKAGTAATYLASVAALAVIGAVSDTPLLISGLPDLLESIILPVLPALVAFFAAYKAKHTPRPDLEEETPTQPDWADPPA